MSVCFQTLLIVVVIVQPFPFSSTSPILIAILTLIMLVRMIYRPPTAMSIFAMIGTGSRVPTLRQRKMSLAARIHIY
ncbi:hypothetical protein F5Y09DRAFT_294320 [Xylaria sp. FL1042]|nr:hypothetical protein F5Y09DRAFT_294320 [Xylaria sp. FL1042]